jgi:hypothetical protein
VVKALDQLRAIYPPPRVQWLLLQGDTRRGPHTGPRRSRARVFDDLIGSAIELPPTPETTRVGEGSPTSLTERDDPPIPEIFADSASGRDECPALPFAGAGAGAAPPPPPPDEPTALFHFYLTVLLAIAILVSSVVEPAAHDSKAA